MTFTIWHNNIGRPIDLAVILPGGEPFSYEGRSGISPGDLGEWLRVLERFGHAITEPNVYPRPTNHRMIGCGVGHSDVDWCESRFREGSMAAYYENGEAWNGERWWDESASSRRYYERSAA